MDLLEVHEYVKKKLQSNKKDLETYENILSTLNNNTEKHNDKLLNQKIDNIKDGIVKNINLFKSNKCIQNYLLETSEIIADYKSNLKVPIKLCFVQTNQINKDNEKIREKKKKLFLKYLQIVSNYTDISDLKLDIDFKEKNGPEYRCKNCDNTESYKVINFQIYICNICNSEEFFTKYRTSYNAHNRLNMSVKYDYDRRNHFIHCINQYQGKQSVNIEPEVYQKLEQCFNSHYLLVGDENTHKFKRYERVSKETILLFLKDLGYSKHYENINLIYYNITDNKPDDITHLEEKLINDFDILTSLYDKLLNHLYKEVFPNEERKSFINTQYVLYQLLLKYKHPCKHSDFSILKTIERKKFHDDISKYLFNILGWNHHSITF